VIIYCRLAFLKSCVSYRDYVVAGEECESGRKFFNGRIGKESTMSQFNVINISKIL